MSDDEARRRVLERWAFRLTVRTPLIMDEALGIEAEQKDKVKEERTKIGERRLRDDAGEETE